METTQLSFNPGMSNQAEQKNRLSLSNEKEQIADQSRMCQFGVHVKGIVLRGRMQL